MNESSVIKGLAQQMIANSAWTELDYLYLVNRIIALTGTTDFDDQAPVATGSLLALMDAVVAHGVINQNQRGQVTNDDMLGAELMNLMLPVPSEFNRQFWQKYAESPTAATDFFFDWSKRVNYIKTREISRNIEFPYASPYGELNITINLSKPEKDPKAIAAAQTVKSSSYPLCQLCAQNEGYRGRLNYPARANHRVIRLELGDESWGFQYSPYAYYNEHAIVFAMEHRPMVVSPDNIRRLFNFIAQFPTYFIGSNADLPIVGGSILTHDHFQAGRYEMPMAKAPLAYDITIPGFALASAGIVSWPMTVIRLRDSDAEKLVQASALIMERWQHFSAPDQDIVAYTADGVRHHTVTPIARKVGTEFELDLVLRDNNVSTAFPDGIFHPHQDVQHIKKENIGLIEVMGLAILPPRLAREMQTVESYLLGEVDHVDAIHQAWADELKAANPNVDANHVKKVVQDAVGAVFTRVLEDAGVFKNTPAGRAALATFIASLA